MDRRLEKNPYAIDAFVVDFPQLCFLRQMDRLYVKHPDAFNAVIE